MAPLTHADYTIAWICALPLEMAAAKVMLDEIHQPIPKPSTSTDPNAYILGDLHGHNIVVACLPTGIYGTISAATIVSHLKSTFPHVEYALMVGIGGGVPNSGAPNSRNDIRLGDVVVSKPVGKYSGVIQYDYGKMVQGGRFEQTGMLNAPPQVLLTHMAYLQANQMTGGNGISTIVSDALKRNPDMKTEFAPPSNDYLFRSSYHHISQENDCEKCDQQQLIYRDPRTTPNIHYGLIASGDQVMKDSETRDLLAQQLGILCFEMEAAGLMNQIPTLVIRGICDYCDSHKQKQWQGYAALTAAAYAKSLLTVVPVSHMDTKPKKIRHWMVSLARNPKFVGRQDTIKELEESITTQDGPRKIAITGLGGVGKTQVALELAYRVRDRNMECSVFWIPCTSHAMIEQMFLQLAQVLGLGNVNPTEAKERVKTYLSAERAGKWLLIFDNADNADMWLHTTPPLEDFLPESEQGRILFTSRNRKLAMKLAPFNLVPIPDVDKETATQILEKTLAQANKDLLKDPTASATLLEQLAFLPLAIAQASGYIIENGISLSTYIEMLQDQEQDAIELLSEDFRDPGRYKDIQNPVITTWLISFKQIQHQDQLAADFLSFMACIDPRNIPQSLLPQDKASRKQITDALGLLNAYSFTNRQDTHINMHRLVHIATRNWLRKNALFSDWIQTVADHMQSIFPNWHSKNRPLWRQYLPHALALVHDNEFVVQENNYFGLTKNVADCLIGDGRYQEAEVLYKKLMRIAQEKAGIEHPDTLLSMSHLASTYRHRGQLDEAENLHLQVLEARKTVLGAEHSDTLNTMNNLAATYWNQGRWDEAEKLQMQVLEARKTVLGAKHPDTLNTMNNLASTYLKQGRWDEAEEMQVQVLEARKTVLGAKHPGTLNTMNSLAATYWNQDRWDEAEEMQVQVLEARKTVLGAKHPDTLNTMNNLASTYLHQGRLDKAEKMQVQVLEACKTAMGAEHPHTLTIMANLAFTWKSLGKIQDALALMKKSSHLYSKVLGPDHSLSISSYTLLRDWMDEHDALSNQPPLTGNNSLQPLQKFTAGSLAAVPTAPSIGEVHNNLAFAQGASPARSFSLNHPLITAVRTPSPGAEGQNLQDVD